MRSALSDSDGATQNKSFFEAKYTNTYKDSQKQILGLYYFYQQCYNKSFNQIRQNTDAEFQLNGHEFNNRQLDDDLLLDTTHSFENGIENFVDSHNNRKLPNSADNFLETSGINYNYDSNSFCSSLNRVNLKIPTNKDFKDDKCATLVHSYSYNSDLKKFHSRFTKDYHTKGTINPRYYSPPISNLDVKGCNINLSLVNNIVNSTVNCQHREVTFTLLEGHEISCFEIGGEKRLCLPQVLNIVLKDFSLQHINAACEELHVYCSSCDPSQLKALKQVDALSHITLDCGLITKTDSERLCDYLLRNCCGRERALDLRNSLSSLNSITHIIKTRSFDSDSHLDIASATRHKKKKFKTLPDFVGTSCITTNQIYDFNDDDETDDNNEDTSFKVYHECFGRCVGQVHFSLYKYPKAACIECLHCHLLFTPPQFVCHSHRQAETRICHWGFDSERWRSYLFLKLPSINSKDNNHISADSTNIAKTFSSSSLEYLVSGRQCLTIPIITGKETSLPSYFSESYCEHICNDYQVIKTSEQVGMCKRKRYLSDTQNNHLHSDSIAFNQSIKKLEAQLEAFKNKFSSCSTSHKNETNVLPIRIEHTESFDHPILTQNTLKMDNSATIHPSTGLHSTVENLSFWSDLRVANSNSFQHSFIASATVAAPYWLLPPCYVSPIFRDILSASAAIFNYGYSPMHNFNTLHFPSSPLFKFPNPNISDQSTQLVTGIKHTHSPESLEKSTPVAFSQRFVTDNINEDQEPDLFHAYVTCPNVLKGPQNDLERLKPSFIRVPFELSNRIYFRIGELEEKVKSRLSNLPQALVELIHADFNEALNNIKVDIMKTSLVNDCCPFNNNIEIVEKLKSDDKNSKIKVEEANDAYWNEAIDFSISS
ncbi:unnamed protein product [Gordionus sp. m RMFG-2023]|uniref:uncharacterized protein LOC135931650 n=1 Tax=Gordionus sp. m RMFG-2023 TaxID=3053472 RepID=UPI0030DE4B24